MLVKGKPTRIVKWIHGDLCVVRVEVDAILPDFDPTEPHLEPATARILDRLQQLADDGTIEELARYGDVYVKQSA